MRIVCFGGFGDYAIQLVNALSKKEEVMLATARYELLNEHLVSINESVDRHLIMKRTPTYHPANLWVFLSLMTRISQFNPDVIHFQLGGALVPSFFLLFSRFLKKYAVVVTFHDVVLHLGEKSWIHEFLRNFIRKYSDQIIVHGEKLREQMIREYKVPSEKVQAISIGEHQVAPFKKYEREDIREDGNMILFFGRIYEYKGLEYLIKAEPMISKEVPDAKIVIAGAGEDFGKYERMMGTRKEHFIVRNYRIPYEEGAELFQRCSVVVLPYIDTSQSGVVHPAYAFEKPVVVTNVGSIPEIVDGGLTGFIVPPKNPKALAEAVIRLLKDERLRKKMGENGYRKLKTDLSWDNIAEKTIEVYEKALHKSKKE